MGSITMSCQINDGCIAVTDEGSSSSILIVNGECLTYTIDKAVVVNRMHELMHTLSTVPTYKTRFSDRVKVKEGLRISDTVHRTVIYFRGEQAVLKDGALYMTNRFDLAGALDLMKQVDTIPDTRPTFEGLSCRARYIKDGNLVIINSSKDCIVFDLSSLDPSSCTIKHCLVNAISYSNVTYVAKNNTLMIYSDNNAPLMEVVVDDPIRYYLNLSSKST